MRQPLILLAALLAAAPALAQSRPHLPRVGPNLLQNPGFAGTTNWYLNGSATHDPAVSRGAGSGSIKITAGYPTALSSRQIPVQAGKTYTFAVYLRSEDWPPQQANIFCSAYDSSGRWVVNLLGSAQATTAANDWQEAAVLCTPGPGHATVQVQVHSMNFPQSGHPVWVDDAWFGEGVGFEQPPAAKTGFTGQTTRVDSLGNFEILKNGQWLPFVPFCMCTDVDRSDWSVYVQAGFNCNAWVWALTPSLVQRAKSAGMMSSLDLGTFIGANGPHYKNYTELATRIRALHDQGLTDSIFMYYFDNETYQLPGLDPANPVDSWTVAVTALQTIEDTEKAITGGGRLWPRMMLYGREGVARSYAPYVEVLSDYIGGDSGGMGTETSIAGLRILDNIEKQPRPYIAQINHPQTAASFRETVYMMLIGGARGFSYWRDLAPGKDPGTYGLVPIETTTWFTELPKLRDEIAQAIDIVREPHWTPWKAESSSGSLTIGTRQHADEGYLFVVNRATAATSATITLTGLPYAPTTVKDFFTGATVATPSGASFALTLPAKGTGLYRLVAPACTSATQCDDGNPCTTDSCPAGSCTHEPITGCGADAGSGSDAGSSLDAAAGLDAGSASGADAEISSDASAFGEDASTVAQDASGVPAHADAGALVSDAEVELPPTTAEGSCGCASGGGAMTLGGWAVALLLSRRRRRRSAGWSSLQSW